jgi:hypothetical protein
MTYHDLYDLIPRAFWNAVDGFWIQKENEERKMWEKLRWQTTCLINVHLPRNKQMTLQKLVKFEWEKTEAGISDESYDDTKFAYEKMLKRKKLK